MGFMEDEPGYDLDGRYIDEEPFRNELGILDYTKGVGSNQRFEVVLIKGYKWGMSEDWTVVQVLSSDVGRGMFWVLIEKVGY